jgi:glutamate dehydrogenase
MIDRRSGADALETVIELARSRWPHDHVLSELLHSYHNELALDDLATSDANSVLDAAVAHLELGRERSSGEVLVSVERLTAGAATLMFVTTDTPFLIDTVRMVLDDSGIGINLLVHPMLFAVRSDVGTLTGFDEELGAAEAWTQIQLDRCPVDLDQLCDVVRAAISNVASVVDDFPAMRDHMRSVAGSNELIEWLAESNFVFLGAASYHRSVDAQGVPTLTLQAGSELGEYRSDPSFDAAAPGLPSKPGDERLVIARSNTVSRVHRAARLTSIAIRTDAGVADTGGDASSDLDQSGGQFDGTGGMGGVVEHRFFGLLGSGAYRESVFAIPVLRDRASAVLELSGASASSHTGRAIRAVVETLPREIVFELGTHELAELVIDIVGLQERRIVRVFDVAEPVGPWTTVLVYLPRLRFVTGLSELVSQLVAHHYSQEELTEVRDVDTLIGSSSLARISMTVRASRRIDLDALAKAIDIATATWDERATGALIGELGGARGRSVFAAVAAAVPGDYRTRVSPETSVEDLAPVADLLAVEPNTDDALVTTLRRSHIVVPTEHSVDDVWRFKVFRRGQPMTISELVPLLDHLGLTALDEHPYVFECPDAPVHLYDIGVRVSSVNPTPKQLAEVQGAFRALVRGDVEADSLNRLVIAADLTVRQVAVIRTYCRYLRQAGFLFSQAYIEQVLERHAEIVHGFIALFDARFNPAAEPHPAENAVVIDALRNEVLRHLDDVPSLDDDRICRALLTLIDATTRTNAFRTTRPGSGDGEAGVLSPEIAVKLDPRRIAFLPEPRPMFEIFVCSPKVEGVHLRAGRVARGGLRWSDRPEDFRTEILGLVKAQMVKNAVIVPVGAKGGFVIKQSTADQTDRDAVRAEGIDRYQRFMRSLLDLTDNLITDAEGGEPTVARPPECVLYDDDDPYLVVAADKGTASFSDIANAIAHEYGFWLGDAFASGGSVGYDHKAMGITARGAWESVRRHARVIGKNVDTDVLTTVGVGDMSGDVFGNGMLLSPHLQLVAAFDHRHVFLDPSPDPRVSYAERERLFGLPRSSWADYAAGFISEGGGVFPRTMKSIPISPQVRSALGLDPSLVRMGPNELMSAILRAPVELLWNGGIGTYVKAAAESHESVGDRSNDAIRIDAQDLRCRIVGEGGNLGLTQLARVEYAIAGGLINTDAIDNSAGVDCSDHEVNIKVALEPLVASGTLTTAERNELLAEMTDDVAKLVLDDNQDQTLALLIARSQSLSMVNVHARFLDVLEADGRIDRVLDGLPSDKQIAERQSNGSGLCVPEFAVMIASTKNANVAEILKSDLPDDPVLEADLFAYFPAALRERFPDAIRGHRLRREIIATSLVNNLVNLSGISFDHRMGEQSGAAIADVARAFLAARNLFDLQALWRDLDSIGSEISLDTQLELFLDVRRMAERGVAWLLRRRPVPLDVAGTIDTFGAGLAFLAESLDEVVAGRVAGDIETLRAARVSEGVPAELAARSARWPWMHTGFDIIEVAHEQACGVNDAAVAYWSVFEAFEVGWLWDGIGGLPRSDRWQTQGRASLRDDLMTVLCDLTRNVIANANGSASEWIEANERAVSRVSDMMTSIRRVELFDLTTLSVALRQLRNLTLN